MIVYHVGSRDSRDTCSACMHDMGYEYYAPGTPMTLSTGCQSCYRDHYGQLRCGGCWSPVNLLRGPLDSPLDGI